VSFKVFCQLVGNRVEDETSYVALSDLGNRNDVKFFSFHQNVVIS